MARVPLAHKGEIADRFDLAPDWVIKILSPAQSLIRVIDNILYCLKYGTQLGWLLDPEEQTVLVLWPEQRIEIFSQADDSLPIPGLGTPHPIATLTLGELYGWLNPKS